MKTIVVGGGIAGLAAATILAEQGVEVVVRESQPSFGGRLRAWPVTLPDGTTLSMERGFHAFFRQYYNLRALMKRWDPNLSRLLPLEDYPILGPDGVRLRFDRLPKKAPWNVAAVALRGGKWLGFKGLLGLDVRQALMMLAWDEADWPRLDAMTAAEFLDGLRFPAEARRMLFDVFAHSFFNPEREMSAGELLMMFHFYFTGNPEGLVFDVLDDAFDRAFVEPWVAHLRARGVRLESGRAVTDVRAGRVDGEACDGVVLATDVRGLRAFREAFSASDRARIDSLEATSPFLVVRQWLDRPVDAKREPFVGTAGLGRLDNISCMHLFEKESAAWAARVGGAVVELHAYGLEAPFTEHEVRDELVARMHELYPETRAARVVHEVSFLSDDCPAFKPGSRALRPTVATETRGLALAGDFVALPFPSALMERAATSGILAANHLLAEHGMRTEEIRTVPARGLLAPFRALFSR